MHRMTGGELPFACSVFIHFSDDMKPSRKYSPVSSCLLKCECKNEDCHYGNDPCACNRSNPCPVNFTMNRMTGGELPFVGWVILEAFYVAR